MELIMNRKRGRPRKPILETDYAHGCDSDDRDEYNNGNRKKTTMSEDARERHR